MANNNHNWLLEETSYWVEKINLELYDAIINFMEKENMNNTELAKVLGISRSRVSQILNDGDINFSLTKIISISLKVGYYPNFSFTDKNTFSQGNNSQNRFSFNIQLNKQEQEQEQEQEHEQEGNCKVIPMYQENTQTLTQCLGS